MDSSLATDHAAPAGAPVDDDWPVAAVMRRVQEQLRRGQAPSFESLLALGEPGRA
jgi:hypothetical protein